MGLDDLQKNWDAYGKEDPMWAILTVPDRKGNKWDPAEFFQRGQDEISDCIADLQAKNMDLKLGRALDFGCGVGRLTQGLCHHFDECHGVDIAPSMIEAARKYNQFGDKCHYHLNEQNDLKLFPDNYFDFIYTVIVLQHMAPIYSKNYIAEFLRVLAPGGILVFQLPAELKPQPIEKPANGTLWLRPFINLYHRGRNRLKSINSQKKFTPKMEMHAVPKEEVIQLINACGGTVPDTQQDGWAGPAWISYTYYVVKNINAHP